MRKNAAAAAVVEEVLPPPPTPKEGTSLIPWLSIEPSKTNPRKVFTGIEELAESIRAQGLLQPLLVRPKPGGPPDRYELVAGERRYRALGLIDVQGPCWCVLKDLDDKAASEIQIVENLQRQDVTALEEADGFARLQKEHRLTPEAIALRVGKKKSYIYSRLKLATLRDEAREALGEGRISASIAELLARIPTAASQAKALEEVLRWGENASVGRVKQMIEDRFMVRLAGAPFDRDDPHLLPKAGSCAACPKLTGNMPELETTGGKAGTAADVCTDPACYRAKVDAEWADRERLAGSGAVDYRIMPEKDAETFRRRSWIGPPYEQADRLCHFDAERRSWKELVGAAAPRVLARTEDGEIVEFYEDRDLLAALTERHPEIAEVMRKDRAEEDDDPDPEIEARNKAREEARAKRQAERDELLAEAPPRARRGLAVGRAFWLMLVELFLAEDAEYGDGQILQDLFERRGRNPDEIDEPDAASAAAKAMVEDLDEADARALFAEVYAIRLGQFAGSTSREAEDALFARAREVLLGPPAADEAPVEPTAAAAEASADVHTAPEPFAAEKMTESHPARLLKRAHKLIKHVESAIKHRNFESAREAIDELDGIAGGAVTAADTHDAAEILRAEIQRAESAANLSDEDLEDLRQSLSRATGRKRKAPATPATPAPDEKQIDLEDVAAEKVGDPSLAKDARRVPPATPATPAKKAPAKRPSGKKASTPATSAKKPTAKKPAAAAKKPAKKPSTPATSTKKPPAKKAAAKRGGR